MKREEKKEKAIDNYLIKYISASLALLLSSSHNRDICIWLGYIMRGSFLENNYSIRSSTSL